jgi:hypothetical protein
MKPTSIAAAALLLGACFVDTVAVNDSTTSAAESDTTNPGDTTNAGVTSTSAAASTTTTQGDTTQGDTTADATTGEGTTGAPTCPGPCDAPPGPCFLSEGACEAGACVYEPAPKDTPCEDQDACTSGESCDGAGLCGGGAIMDCARPNADGGACNGGVCGGWTCSDPWENCDGDWSNGCEIPTGIANRCAKSGLDAPGACWTAYCGSSDEAKVNFGTFYCAGCANCHVPAPGLVQWCNPTSGQWFTPAEGSCGVFEDNVCPP